MSKYLVREVMRRSDRFLLPLLLCSLIIAGCVTVMPGGIVIKPAIIVTATPRPTATPVDDMGILTPSPEPTPTGESATPRPPSDIPDCDGAIDNFVVATTAVLNLRPDPSTRNTPVGLLSVGKELEVQACETYSDRTPEGWLAVETLPERQPGYVSAAYVRFVRGRSTGFGIQ